MSFSLKVLPAAILALGIAAGDAAARDDTGKPVVTDPDPFAYVTPADREKMRAQGPLLEAAHPIREAAEKDAESHGASGFTSVELGDGKLVVRWKGALPASVKKAVDSARGKAAVDVVAAKHSRQALRVAVHRIEQALVDGADAAFAVAADESGVTVETEGDVERARKRLPHTGVPTRVKAGKVDRSRSRLADTAPFWGGARIRNVETGSSCSTGFSVTDGWRDYVLTAGHCGRPNAFFHNGNDSIFVGGATREHVAHDLLLIPSHVGGRMYDGGVGVNEFSKRVAGSGHSYPNEWLCVSGSVTGAVCGIQVSTEFTRSYCNNGNGDMYGTYECYSDLVAAYHRGGVQPARGGDSGGPVFGLSGNDVIAKGIISGGVGTRLLYQDWATVNRDFGVWPLT